MSFVSTPVSLRDTVMVAPGQLSSELSGEAVILQLSAGKYFTLNATGARVWQFIQQQQTLQSVREMLVKEFDVSPQRCEADLLALAEKLHAAGLIVVQHACCS